MKTPFYLLLIFVFAISCKKEQDITRKAAPPDQTEINKLKLNQIQILGSHNSYHKRMDARLFSAISNINFLLPAAYQVNELDYFHEPLADQLDTYGLRGLEIDIYNDPNGGLFYNRAANSLARMSVASYIPELNQPGLKVLHIPDVDYETYYYTFKSMLSALKSWSDAHPNHLPVFLHIETKETAVTDVVPLLSIVGLAQTIKYTPALADNIDTEIKAVFGDALEKVITPDKVRGSYTTLKEAVQANNWPTIGEARGKFVFVMEGGGREEYLQGHPSLQDRAMFVYSESDTEDESSFLIYNEASRDKDEITLAVKNNFIVRTRADGTNKQNRTGDYTQQTDAFSSGAQIVSTDYYRPDPRYLSSPGIFTNYACRFPNGELARINAISAADKQGIGRIAE
ncbi:MAG: Ca2+-dependent phosphoinositide-specific phospholipase C [Chitinophagales bacterium]